MKNNSFVLVDNIEEYNDFIKNIKTLNVTPPRKFYNITSKLNPDTNGYFYRPDNFLHICSIISLLLYARCHKVSYIILFDLKSTYTNEITNKLSIPLTNKIIQTNSNVDNITIIPSELYNTLLTNLQKYWDTQKAIDYTNGMEDLNNETN